jgi:hypothetical protein
VRVEPARGTTEPTRSDSLEDRLRLLAIPLRGLNAAEVATRFALPAASRLLKTTLSLCPQCLTHVHAAVFATEGKVYIAKECPTHGASLALLENDARYYRLSTKDQWGKRYVDESIDRTPAFENGGCCGPGTTCGTEAIPGGSYDTSDQ